MYEYDFCQSVTKVTEKNELTAKTGDQMMLVGQYIRAKTTMAETSASKAPTRLQTYDQAKRDLNDKFTPSPERLNFDVARWGNTERSTPTTPPTKAFTTN